MECPALARAHVAENRRPTGIASQLRIDDSINQSINAAINHPTNQPTTSKQASNQSAKQSTNRSWLLLVPLLLGDRPDKI